MNFDNLKSPELQEKLKACKSIDELVSLAKEEDMELSDEQLNAMSGGSDCDMLVCYEVCPFAEIIKELCKDL